MTCRSKPTKAIGIRADKTDMKGGLAEGEHQLIRKGETILALKRLLLGHRTRKFGRTQGNRFAGVSVIEPIEVVRRGFASAHRGKPMALRG